MLTAKFVATAKQGRHLDQRGLYLEVSLNLKRRWVLRYQKEKRTTEVALGSAEFVTLQQARERAFEFRRNLANGVVARKPQSFASVAAEVIEAKAPGFKQGTQSVTGLKWCVRLCAPIAERDVAAVTVEEMAALLRSLSTKPAAAERVRAFAEDVFANARTRELRSSENPAVWRNCLDQLLPRRPQSKHHKAVPYAELPALMRRLQQRGWGGDTSWRSIKTMQGEAGVVSRSLQFLILTALRKGEVREARWSEIEGDTLVIDAARMKSGRQFKVPLSAPALVILDQEQRLGSGEFIFGSYQPLASSAMNELLIRLGVAGTVHGMRSAARDFAADMTDFPREVAEAMLSHTVQGVEGAYKRTDFFAKRRDLMNMWAAYLCGPDGP